jgi:hypothetical protein
MEAEIEQPLANVHRLDLAFAEQRAGAGDELVHARPIVRHVERLLHPGPEVICIEDGILADGFQAVRPKRPNVAVTAKQDADVAEETPHSTNRLRAIVVEKK